MEKLSEAGKLYLKDYLVLDQVRKDLNRFLNTVVNEIYEIILEETDDLSPEGFKLKLWKNKSSKGHMQVKFLSLKDRKLFRKDRGDLYIIYKDIRNTTDLSSPASVKVYVHSPTIASELEEELRGLSRQELDRDIYEAEVVEFDSDSSSQIAEKVAEQMLDQCNLLRNLIKKLDE